MNFPRALGRSLSRRYNQSLELPHKFGHLRRDLLLNSRRRTHKGSERPVGQSMVHCLHHMGLQSKPCSPMLLPPPACCGPMACCCLWEALQIIWGQLQKGRPDFFTLPLRHCPKICHEIPLQRQTPAPVINTLFHLLKKCF